ncbi:MAG: glycosyltransferase family 87 protein [Thiohalocapsa sp.]
MPLLSWPPASGKFRLLAGILLVSSALYGLAYFAFATGRGWPAGFGDSFALWSWGRFVVEHPPATIYDAAALRTAQLAMGLAPGGSYPFAYPPTFMLVIWPLGQVPGWLSLVALMAVSLPLYLWASLGRRWRGSALVAALAAPTTAITIVSGQSGFLAAGLLAGGLRLAASHPRAAGALLALLTYKPQLGLLVPVALVAGRLWRSLLWALAGSVLLVLLTALLFGPAVWPAWLAALPAFSRQVAAESGGILHLMPTVLAALLRLGIPPATAQLAQWMATAAAAVAVWLAYRHGSRPLAAAALLIAAPLATPYAFVYDMPVVTTAVIWFVADRGRGGVALGTGEVLAIMLAMLSPATLAAGHSRFPLATLSVILLVGVVVRAALQSSQPAPSAARLRAAESR